MAVDLVEQIYIIPDHLRGDTWDGIPEIIINKDGVPLNLEDGGVLIQFRKDVDKPVLLELSTANGGVVFTDAANGKFSIPPRIVSIPPATYQYDIQVTDTIGNVKTYIKGTWTIVGDISHV